MKKTNVKIWQLASVIFGLIAILSLMGCSSSYNSSSTTNTTNTSAPATSAPASSGSVNISGFAFSPATLTVSVGTTVTWTNNDSVAHTVTSDNGVFDSGNLPNGKTYSYTFSKTGTFPYHCTIHPNMTATVTVQ